MKKLRNILTILLCMTLFQSSCDLLSDTEAEVMNDLKVNVSMGVFVFKWVREWDQMVKAPASEPVHIKLYKRKSTRDEVLLDRLISPEELSAGMYSLQAGPYYFDEKEVFKISAYLAFYPTEYCDYSLKYADTKILPGLEDEQGIITYTWYNSCNLSVPEQGN
jgi:hypothetical protein